MKTGCKFMKSTKISLICLIFTLSLGFGSPIFAQKAGVEKKSGDSENAKSTPENKNYQLKLKKIQKYIRSLEKSVDSLIEFKIDKQGQDKLTIHLDANVQTEYGYRSNKLVEEFALVKLSGKKIVSLTFQEKAANLISNSEIITKQITRSDFGSDSFDNLELAQITDMEFRQGDTIAYKLKEFGSLYSQERLLLMYRDYLTKLEFRLQSLKLKKRNFADMNLSDVLKK